MAELVVHRGGREIGGSAIELSAVNSRVLLDLGLPLNAPVEHQYDIGTLRAKGVLPDIQGLYLDQTPGFDALIISHAHLDHYGLISFVHPEIPIYLSSGSKVLLDLGARFLSRPVPSNKQISFEMGVSFEVSKIKITPYLMDHSAFDAAAFEIVADGCRVVYTGDFRQHGRKAGSFRRFLRQVTPSPDVLVCEGTTLGRDAGPAKTENELETELVGRLQHEAKIALFQCSSQNIDRLVTFCRVAMKTNRVMVVDAYTAEVLEGLQGLGNKLPTVGSHRNLRLSPPKDPGKTLMMVRPSMLRRLADNQGIRDGVYIYSLWGGYREDARQKELESFLMGRGFTIEVAHTSGHADPGTIRLLIQSLKPSTIIPVHTNFPWAFEEFSDKVLMVHDGEAIVCKGSAVHHNKRERVVRMPKAYTKDEILSKVDERLSPDKVSSLYAQGFVNYKGRTSDTKEKYTEVIAKRLIEKQGALEKIPTITRTKLYRTNSHVFKPIDPKSPRKEEHIARSMKDKIYPHIGKIIDYQTPLKDVRSDEAGKIDLLSWNEMTRRAYILELKAPDRKETLLRCVLEAHAYRRRVNSQRLLSDFCLPKDAFLRKGGLVYRSSIPHTEFAGAEIRRLMKALEVDLFVLDEENQIVEAHYWEDLEV